LKDINNSAVSGAKVMGQPVIFIGSLEEAKDNKLIVTIKKVIYGGGLHEGDVIDVFYNPSVANILLGVPSKGDAIQIYGELNERICNVSSERYGLVNLKYLHKEEISKEVSRFERHSSHKPLSFSVANIHIGFSIDTDTQLYLSMGVTGNYYGTSRKGTTGLLQLMPSSRSGKYSFKISATVSVNEYSHKIEKSWEESLDIILGKMSYVPLSRIPIPFDIIIATVEVGITPIVTFKPTEFGMFFSSPDSIVFPWFNTTIKHYGMTWSNHQLQDVPLIFTSDNISTIDSGSYLAYEMNLQVKLDVTIKTIIGEKKFDIGTFTLDKIIGARDLEPKHFKIASFEPCYFLTLQAPRPFINITINDIPYSSDEQSKIITLLPYAQYKIEVPKVVMVSKVERLLFTNWSDGNQNNILRIQLIKDTHLMPYYKKQYYVRIISPIEIGGEGWYDENAIVTINALQVNATEKDGVRYLFIGWEGSGLGSYSGKSPIISLTVHGPLEEKAIWKKQYYLTLKSNYGKLEGEGWHDEGKIVTFSIAPTILDFKNGTRVIFTEWTGDIKSSDQSASIIMDSPKTIIATWKKQYYLEVISSHGTPLGSGWYDKDSIANISIESSIPIEGWLGSIGAKYVFAGWIGDIKSLNSSVTIIMDRPKSVTAIWKTDYTMAYVILLVIFMIFAISITVFLLTRRKRRTYLAKEQAYKKPFSSH
jgi:hypothetical protein